MKEAQNELIQAAAQGAQIAAVSETLFPYLESLKESIFQEFAHTKAENSLHLARLSGEARMVDRLIRQLTGSMEDGKAASEQLQRGGH